MQKIKLLKSGQGKDLGKWGLFKRQDEELYALLEISETMEIGREIELSERGCRQIQWMKFYPFKPIEILRSPLIIAKRGVSFDSKFNFGLFTGYQIGIVYGLQPSYIEWCIINVPFFCIKDLQLLQSYGVVRKNDGYSYLDLNDPSVITLIDSFNSIQSMVQEIGMSNVEFRLSDEVIELNNRKLIE